MGKQKVQLVRRNWDIDYVYDIVTGKGFTITEPAEFQTDDKSTKSLYGSRSPLYGTDFGDEQAFLERHRCSCGEFRGAQFKGEECPICKTIIDYKDTDIEFTGWISLGDNSIIAPYYYNLMMDVIGKATVPEIARAIIKVDTDGHPHKLSAEEIQDNPKHPFVGIGVIEFRERFEEVMKWFQVKKKNKASRIDTLLKEKGNVFTSHIPIYSTLLRPQSATSDTYYYNSMDKHINPLFNLSEKLKDNTDLEKSLNLWRIQTRVNSLWDINFNLLCNRDDGFIREQILGGALNFTSRNVIVPDPTLRDNEVDIAYNTFLELFKYRIIYYIMKMDDVSLAKAFSKWSEAFIFDNKVYETMLYILEKEKPSLLINRNPTLNYSSMLLMKIRNIKRSIEDYTLSVPLSILPGLNADFDGDILNIIALVHKQLAKSFKKFDPITRMIVSRDTGLLNDYFNISKGQIIDLYLFNSI